MPLQNSGPISLSNIQTEFGGANPISISEYYAGGNSGFVPGGTTGVNGAVPTSGQISFSKFYGTTKSAIATLSNHSATVDHTASGQSGEASSSATLTVNNNGQLSITGGTGWSSFWQSQGTILINGSQYWDTSQAGSSETVNVQNWLIGSGASTYSCRGTIQAGSTEPNNNGTFRFGTYGSWLSLASTREFTISTSSVGIPQSIDLVLLLQFAKSDNLTNILGSCTITFAADSYWTDGGLEP